MLIERHLDVLLEGVKLCQRHQEALLRVGSGILEKRQIRITEKFRYTMLNDLSEADVALFSQPIQIGRAHV